MRETSSVLIHMCVTCIYRVQNIVVGTRGQREEPLPLSWSDLNLNEDEDKWRSLSIYELCLLV